jgi:DNA invertase Pin-like site-specific DNA recombinase
MAQYGCARISTLEQSLGIQRAALKAAGCDVIHAEKASGVYKGRKQKIDATTGRELRYREKHWPADIARRLRIGRASVYRVLGKKAA